MLIKHRSERIQRLFLTENNYIAILFLFSVGDNASSISPPPRFTRLTQRPPPSRPLRHFWDRLSPNLGSFFSKAQAICLSWGVFRRDSKSRKDTAVRPSRRVAFPEGTARWYACPRSAALLPSAATMQIGSKPSIRTNRACWSRSPGETNVHASCPYPKAANELFSAFSAASESGSELIAQHSPARVPLMY